MPVPDDIVRFAFACIVIALVVIPPTPAFRRSELLVIRIPVAVLFHVPMTILRLF